MNKVSQFRRRRKNNLIKVSGNQCCLCGYHKTNSALEFHHLVPEEKSYSIAKNGTCHDLEKDLAEIKKCILVCANCHREIHDGLYALSFLKEKQIFLEEEAEELRRDKQQKITKTIYYCNKCGKQLRSKTLTGMCQDCYRQSTRHITRPSRAELKDLIRKMPFTKIAQQYNVSDNAIRKWCKAEHLPSTKKEINYFTNEEWQKI